MYNTLASSRQPTTPVFPTHTHAQTCTHTHRTNIQTHTHTHAHTHTHTYAHTHTCTSMHKHTHTHIFMHTCNFSFKVLLTSCEIVGLIYFHHALMYDLTGSFKDTMKVERFRLIPLTLTPDDLPQSASCDKQGRERYTARE